MSSASNDGNSGALYDAIKADNVPLVMELLQQQNTINVMAPNVETGASALHMACFKSHVEIVKLLLQHDSMTNVNVQDRFGSTPLHNACYAGTAEIVQILLQHPTMNVNVLNSTPHTGMAFAISHGVVNVVQQLLNGVGIPMSTRLRDGRGGTPLQVACALGHWKVVQQLLQYDVIDVNMKNGRGGTPLYVTCDTIGSSSHHAVEVVKALLQHPELEVNVPNWMNGWTPLHAATSKCKDGLVQQLLQHPQLNVNVKDHLGLTPLLHACTKRHTNILKMFLQHDAKAVNVNATDQTGWTILHKVCYNHNLESVKALLNHPKIDVNIPIRDDRQMTPLHMACQNGHLQMVQALLQHSQTDVNVLDQHGKTPLHYATSSSVNRNHPKDQYNIVKQLLQHSAIDVNAKDNAGFVPLHYAIQNGFPDKVELLLTSSSCLQVESLLPTTKTTTTDQLYRLWEYITTLSSFKGKPAFHKSSGCVTPFLLLQNASMAKVLLEAPFRRNCSSSSSSSATPLLLQQPLSPHPQQAHSPKSMTTTKDIRWMSRNMYYSTNHDGKTLLQLAKERLSSSSRWQPYNQSYNLELVQYLESFINLSLSVPVSSSSLSDSFQDCTTEGKINPQLDEFQTFLARRIFQLLNEIFWKDISYTIMAYLNVADVMAREKRKKA